MDGKYSCHFLDKLWTPCFSRSIAMLSLLSALFLSTVIDALQVIGGNTTVAQGDTAVLPCKLIDTTETIIQVSWERMTKAKPQNEHFFTTVSANGDVPHDAPDRFKFVGHLKGNNGSLQLSNVTLMDEGTYTCIFTLFPSGNHWTKIHLNVLVPPVSSLQDNHPVLGDKEVSLVTCTAAGSKPPAEVKWITGTLGEKLKPKISSTEHANGTTTTVSSLFGVPIREINSHSVECVVTSAALPKEETLAFTIQVNFPPTEVTIRKQAKGLFECVTDANPKPDITWTSPDNLWPQSAVTVEGATLQFVSMTADLTGLYQCEASNTYGTKSILLYVDVAAGGSNVYLVLFCLLLLLNAAAAVLYLYKAGKFQRIVELISSGRAAVATTSSSPREAEADMEVEVEGLRREEPL
ncbi:nectin-1 isoform 1-T1 [Symphorus nematophorus]